MSLEQDFIYTLIGFTMVNHTKAGWELLSPEAPINVCEAPRWSSLALSKPQSFVRCLSGFFMFLRVAVLTILG